MKITYKFIISIALIMITLCNFLGVYSLAAQEYTAEYRGECGNLIMRNGHIIKVSYVVINNNGIECPLYCLDKDKDGVGEAGNYNVSLNEVIKDASVYKAIKNGYPYKSIESMGCANYKEAFTATKMAVYSVLYGYTIDNFKSLGTPESDRTYNAIKNILEAVEKTSDGPKSSKINIVENDIGWKQDENNKNYVFKIMNVKSESEIKKYQVFLEGNYPEGTLIVDKNNNFRESYTGNEEFKVMIPIKELKDNTDINLKVIGELKTYPIYVGKTSIEGTQDYAVTKFELEEGVGNKNINISENKTKIKIIKKDDLGNALKDAVFELYDENKNILKTNLTTNENGEIIIDKLNPGRYYIKEKFPPEGYINYDKYIEVNVKLNEELTVIVRNLKEEEPVVEVERNILEVRDHEEQIKLPKTGM